jgi:hypothetical protein
MKQYKNTNYFVTTDGMIWSTKTKMFLKGQKTKRGYLQVSILTPKYKKLLVHRIVAETYIENPMNKATVNHKNLDKIDNRVENLEWLTIKENLEHAYKNGIKPGRKKVL